MARHAEEDELKRCVNNLNTTPVSLNRRDLYSFFGNIGSDLDQFDLDVIFDSVSKVNLSELVDSLCEKRGLDTIGNSMQPSIDNWPTMRFYFQSLDKVKQEQALSMVRKLHAHSKAQQAYDTLDQMEKTKLEKLIGSCSESDDGVPGQLDRNKFVYLHAVVLKILKGEDEETRKNASCACPEDPMVAFQAADLEIVGTVTATEVFAWLGEVAEALPTTSHKELLGKVMLSSLAFREVEKYAKASELQQSLRQYSEAYRKVLSSPDHELVCTRLPECDEDLMQPPVPGKGAVKDTTYDDLVVQGKQIVRQVQKLGAELCQAMGAMLWSMGSIKARPRSEEKIKVDYGDEGRCLLDVVRFSLVCDNLTMLNNAVRWLDSREDIEIVRVKSGFDSNSAVAVRSGGYRDVKLNVKHKHNGHLFEVQLHLLAFYCLKHESGHALYKWARQFSVEGITCAEDVLTFKNKDLLNEMIVLASERLSVSIEEWGESSLPVMEQRIVVANLAHMADLPTVVSEHVECLLVQAEGKELVGISKQETAEIYLLCASSRHYEADKSLQLAQQAMDEIKTMKSLHRESIYLGDWEMIFLGRCHSKCGSLLWRKGELQKALMEYRDAIATFSVAVAPQHPKIVGFKSDLAAILVQVGDVDEGLAIMHEVEEVTTHPVKLSRLFMELGVAYEKKKNYAKAIQYLHQTLEKRLGSFGEQHIAVANAYLPLGRCNAKAGNKDEALKFLHLALDVYELMVRRNDGGTRGQAVKKSHNETTELIAEVEALGIINDDFVEGKAHTIIRAQTMFQS